MRSAEHRLLSEVVVVARTRGVPVNRTGFGAPELAAVLTLHIDQVTDEVVAALDGAGVEAILLKGPSIARWLYPEGGRAYGDTDLLVPASSFGRAVGVLESLGFTGLIDNFAAWERNEMAVERVFVRRPSDGHREVVDLHRNLPGVPVPDDVLWEAFREECETIVLAAGDVWVLGETALALHVVLHALQHLYEDQPDHPAEDLRRAIQALPPPGWQRVAELARRLGIESMLAAGLWALPEGAEVADRLGFPDGRRDGPSWWYSGTPRGVISLLEFWSASNWSGRARWVRRVLFPSHAKVRYMLSSPDATGAALAALYVRHWRRVAASSGPAFRFVVRHRREIDAAARPSRRVNGLPEPPALDGPGAGDASERRLRRRPASRGSSRAAVTVARRKLDAFRSLSWSDRAMVAEAAVLLSGAHLTLRVAPYRRFRRWLTAGPRGAAWDPLVASRVRRAVAMASRNLPFEVVCLPQAMAAKVMLARRSIGSSLVLGAGHDDDHGVSFHAWLESGGTVVTGGAGRSSVTPMVSFGRQTGP